LLRRLEVQERRQTDVDKVDIVAAQYIGIGGDRLRACRRSDPRHARRIHITDRDDLVECRVGEICVDMRGANSGADHCDAESSAHCRFPNSVAIACAFRASSITLKQCACGIARSVRSSTSATRFAAYGKSASLQST